MKANELRIGNWFIEKDEVKQFDGDFYHLLGCEPIPLNTKWLEKFGFEYSEFNDLYQKGGYDVDIKDNVYCHFYMNEYGDWYKDIDHVHSLQNLYFALTGKELTIKDTANG
jgi:hypothetical protein